MTTQASKGTNKRTAYAIDICQEVLNENSVPFTVERDYRLGWGYIKIGKTNIRNWFYCEVSFGLKPASLDNISIPPKSGRVAVERHLCPVIEAYKTWERDSTA